MDCRVGTFRATLSSVLQIYRSASMFRHQTECNNRIVLAQVQGVDDATTTARNKVHDMKTFTAVPEATTTAPAACTMHLEASMAAPDASTTTIEETMAAPEAAVVTPYTSIHEVLQVTKAEFTRSTDHHRLHEHYST